MADNIKFILASASPRRRDLLNSAGIPHTVFVTDADEAPAGSPAAGGSYAEYYAREASRAKGKAATTLLREDPPEDLRSLLDGGGKIYVISADTVVSPDGEQVFGKPETAAHAREMLSILSGREHFVIGGITVTEMTACGTRSVSECVSTSVFMKELTEREIGAYIESGEPDGKAGAYAIQGLGGAFVSSVKGDYPNVVGISVFRLIDILSREFGVNLTEEARAGGC